MDNKEKSLSERIEDSLSRNAAELPNIPGLKCLYSNNEWRGLTWSQLLEEVNKFANNLKSAGCKEGDRIGLIGEGTIEWVVAFFGILTCQATAVLFDPKLTTEQLDKQVKFADIYALFMPESMKTKLSPSLFEKTLVFNLDNLEKMTNNAWPIRENDLDKDSSIASIIFTSGTSGTYRAAMLSHENLIATYDSIESLDLNPLLNILPWNHVFGLTASLLVPIDRKSLIVVVQKPDWTSLTTAMQAEHPVVMPCVPRVLNLIHGQFMGKINQLPIFKQKLIKKLINISDYLRHNWNINIGKLLFPAIHKVFGGNLKVFVSGGAALPLQTLRDFEALGFIVLEGYGLTETAGKAAANTIKTRTPGTVGLPGANVQLHIAFPDAKGNGEICIKGPNVMRGYFRDPQTTEASLVDGWYRTGDRGHIDKHGNLVITGRIKELIVTSTGKKVAPEEIEHLYSAIPGVQELAVVGFSKEGGLNDEIYAALVLDSSALTLEQRQDLHVKVMENFLERSKKLPAHMQIQSIVVFDELPKTSTLKIKRKELLAMISQKKKQEDMREKDSLPMIEGDATEEALLKEVSKELNNILPSKQDIDPAKHLSELGVDSLSALYLINNLNDRYGIILTTERIFANPTVYELVRFIAKGPQKEPQEAEKPASKERSFAIVSQQTTSKKQLKTDHIFLTGTTGVLGGYLVGTLLQETPAHLYCLIRSDTEVNARKRLRSFLEVYETDQSVLDQMENRVHPVLGDVTRERFGLSEKDYKQLTSQIDLTIHSAAAISLHGSYEPLKEVNVNGTARIIDFAMQTPQKYLAYISTYTVMGDRHLHSCDPFSEKDYDKGQGFEGLGYQRTKFESEQLVRAAGDKGLNWIILRPGDIFGDSKTGCYPLSITNVQSLFYDLLKTVVETKCALNSALYFDMVPVDYVAKAISYLCTQKKDVFSVYHLTNPKPHHFFEIIQILQRSGHEIELVSSNEYIRRLKMNLLHDGEGAEYHSMTTELFKLNPQLVKAQDSSYPICTETQRILEAAGIKCPEIDENLLSTYVQYCERKGYIHVPRLSDYAV